MNEEFLRQERDERLKHRGEKEERKEFGRHRKDR